MLDSDIKFAQMYNIGIRNVLTRICGFDEVSDKVVVEEVEKLDNNPNLLIVKH